MAEPEKKRISSEKRKRQYFAQARVTEQEKAELASRAEQAGMSIGDYIRKCTLGAKPLRARRKVANDEAAVLQLSGQLLRIGTNINQLTRKANAMGFLDQAEKETLFSSLQQINALRDSIRKALSHDT